MSNKGGWIKLYRELLDKPIWFESTPEQKVILVTLLLMANHDGRQWEWQGQQYYAGPGQFVTSLAKIAEKAGPGISIKNVRTALARFEKYEFLANQSTKRNRLITINNWAFYQDKDYQGGKETGKEVAKTWQRGGKDLATNKNVRNKEYKNKEIEEHEEDGGWKKIVQLYEELFGVANSINIQNLNYWCHDLSPELVYEALKVSARANANNFKYTERVMQSWEQAGVKNLKDVEAYTKRFEKSKNYQKPVKGYDNDVELPF